MQKKKSRKCRDFKNKSSFHENIYISRKFLDFLKKFRFNETFKCYEKTRFYGNLEISSSSGDFMKKLRFHEKVEIS